MRVSLCVLLLAFPVFAEGASVLTWGFEDIATGVEVSKVEGWTENGSGAGMVTVAEGRKGSQCLKILSSQITRFVEARFVPSRTVIFLDFAIRPAIDASLDPAGIIDANGAVLGFVRSKDRGLVVAVVSSAKSETVPNSIDTGLEFALDDQGQVSKWIRITIREDLGARKWDLFVDGELTLVDQPLHVAAGVKSPSGFLDIYSSVSGSSFVDEVSISEINPLFPDTDVDGVPDAVEMANGTNAFYDDRTQDPNFNGLSNIEDFRKGNSLTLSTDPLKASRRLVYINNQIGSDSETGEISYNVNKRGPKRTLRGAAEVKGSDVVFVMMPSDQPYVCPNYPAGTAPNVSYVLLGNATLAGE